jgi:aconitate hydratase
MFKSRYADVFKGPNEWQKIGGAAGGETYGWHGQSTYVQKPALLLRHAGQAAAAKDIKGAYALAIFGGLGHDRPHFSGRFDQERPSPAGKYLVDHGVTPQDFNSYGARRGNHEIMMRGTFANIRIKNEMVPGTEGGLTKHIPSGEQLSIYDASMKYQKDGVPLIVVAGKEYGTGSSRDWAAKGTTLLGVKAVIAESFERIHRSNLVGMGVLPLQFKDGMTRQTLKLDGTETYDIAGIEKGLKPRQDVIVTIHRSNGKTEQVTVLCRIDTLDEIEYYKNGGILHYVLRSMTKAA